MKRLARRMAASVFVVWSVVSLAFAIDVGLPGDPARMVAGPQARLADVARIRDQLGLDRPPIVQYARFWRRLVHFGPHFFDPSVATEHASCAVVVPLGAGAVHVDLGKSFQFRQPVTNVIAGRWLRTLALALAGLFLQLSFGVATGVAAAGRPGSWPSRLLLGASLFGISAPTFLIAIGLQYAFAFRLRWLPIDGFGTTLTEHALCLVLPATTLGIYGAAYYTRLVRDEMIGLLRQDWVRTARAKGASPFRVLTRHALRNALAPIVAAAGVDFGALMGGAVVTETVFRWPGIGELSVRAALHRDGPVVLACVIVTSMAVVMSSLAADLICARLGRHEGEVGPR